MPPARPAGAAQGDEMRKAINLLTPSRPLPYGGYIAPTGDFYVCPYGAHRALLDYLKGAFSDVSDWLHVGNEGDILLYHVDYKITLAQMDMIKLLLDAPFDEELPPEITRWKYVGDWYIKAKPDEWRENIMDAIELAEVLG